MRSSQYFLPVLKENPAEAAIASHRFMLRAGLIRQEAAGIYSWLPMGWRVLQKITQIVRDEQNRAGAIEMLMPTLQSADLWRQSGRYEAYGAEMLRIRDRHERDLLYGPTNEEMITAIFAASARSYRDLPRILYHIQWKFRDEIRPRFGIMRGREFLMKDAYSFDLDIVGARQSYNRMFLAYLNSFARMGLKAVPMQADTGPIGGDLSHEFIVLADTGESQVFCHRALVDMAAPGHVDWNSDLSDLVATRTNFYAATEEQHDADAFAKIPAADQISARGIEVGHIFFFGDKYSKPMGCTIMGPDGQERPAQMGSYGIGVSRLVGAIIEANHDEAGIIWPASVSPFDLGILNLKPGDPATDTVADEFYQKATDMGHEVLLDDRDDRAGAKFATMDLVGVPVQAIIGPKNAAQRRVEIKLRRTNEKIDLSFDDALQFLAKQSSMVVA